MDDVLEAPVQEAGARKQLVDFIKEAMEQLSKKPRIEPRVPAAPGQADYIPVMDQAAVEEERRLRNLTLRRERGRENWEGMTQEERAQYYQNKRELRRSPPRTTPAEQRAQGVELEEAQARSAQRQDETVRQGHVQRVKTAAQRRAERDATEQQALKEQAQLAKQLARQRRAERPVADVQPEAPPPPRARRGPPHRQPKRTEAEEAALRLQQAMSRKLKEPGDD